MPRFSLVPARLLRRPVLGLALMLVAAGAVRAQPAASASPIPPGEARVWFYRVFFPDDTGGMPAVAMNGNRVGYARAGWSFYRDVPAGRYRVTVATSGVDVNQAQDVALAPGEQVYVAIQSDPLRDWDFRGARRGTYYVGFEPPNIAAIHMSQMRLGDGT